MQVRTKAVGLGLAAFLVRILWLGKESVWVDEAYTWHVARLDPLSIVRLQEQTPPLYNLFMHAWIAVAGTSEAALRFPSAVFGAAAVAVLYLLGRRLVSEWAATVASLFLALSWFQVRLAQTARTYPLFVLATAVSFLAFVTMAQSGWRRHRVAYVAATAAMLYSHVYGLFFLAAQAGAFLAMALPLREGVEEWRKAWRTFPLLAGASLTLWAPWLGIFLSRAHTVRRGFWITPISLNDLRTLGSALGGGYASIWLGRIEAALCFLLAGVAVALLLTRRPNLGEAVPTRRQTGVMLALGAGTAIAGGLLLSALVRPLFVPQYGAPAWGFAYLLVAAGTEVAGKRWRTVLAIVLVVAMAVNLAAVFRQPQNADWRSLTHQLDAQAKPGALVLNSFGYCDSNSSTDYQCAVDYYSTRPDLRLVPFIDSYYREMTPQDQAGLRALLNRTGDAWAIYADRGSSALYLEEQLRMRLGAVEQWEFTGLRLVHYERGGP